MDLLKKPLNSFTFDEVVAFAKENHQEDVQLEYKKELPDKEKLAQLVAAFANARGGVIIVGIAENRDNGRPAKWEGIDDGRHDEFIAQVIGNISPIPGHEFHKTDDKKGKVFLLVRVFEGDETPYYAHNDSNIWVRTGSVKKSVEIASPEHIELLFKKSEKAEMSRIRNEDRAKRNYAAFLENAEMKRLDPSLQDTSFASDKPFGTNAAMLTILLQPFYPSRALIRPLDMEILIRESEADSQNYSFPSWGVRWNSIQEGMITFEPQGGDIFCQQVFANGLTFSSTNVLRNRPHMGECTFLSLFAHQLYITLRGSRNLLSKLGYKGSLLGSISLSGSKNLHVIPCLDHMLRLEEENSVFDNYRWSIETDTSKINNENQLRELVTEIIRDIHWSFGFKTHQKSITTEKLEQRGFFIVRES